MSIYHNVRTSHCFLTVVFCSWVEKGDSFGRQTFKSLNLLLIVLCILQLPDSPSRISSFERTPKCSGSGWWSPTRFGPHSKGNCLCCGSCGHPLDVQRAFGQPVACRDGLPQTSLSCQLTRFPRVPQCQRPSESVPASTWEGEAGKMFTFVPDSQTRAAKQWLSGNESNCVWFSSATARGAKAEGC